MKGSKNYLNSNSKSSYDNKTNNFVAKHDFNRASIHRDLKNDYNRSDNKEYLDEELNFIYQEELENE